MSQIGKIDLKDIARRTIFQSSGCAPRNHTLTRNMDMRFDHLLGAVGYTALAIAALGAAWLLADVLGGGMAGVFPTAPARLFG
jgi:hypothetical protein